MAEPALRRVLNATGVVIHTNLGRAPLGRAGLECLADIAAGYCDLEFDLPAGDRGNRQRSISAILRRATGAEDALVVNNNAAALLLTLGTLAAGREVIVSRGELIEIGDSFRLPEIMATSGATLVAVGTANCTDIEDYEAAISGRCALLFKAHTSNYTAVGQVRSVALEALIDLGRRRFLPLLHDLGSGMLRRPAGLALEAEPTVQEALAAGADLVTFSGDKMLGGPQAGIIAGRKDLIARLARAPLMRALRPCKLTLTALAAAVDSHDDDARLTRDNPVFRLLSRSADQVRELATTLLGRLHLGGVAGQLVESPGQVGGGACPGLVLPGWGVAIVPDLAARCDRERFAETLHRRLMLGEPPVVANLRQGRVVLDARALEVEDLEALAGSVKTAVRAMLAVVSPAPVRVRPASVRLGE